MDEVDIAQELQDAQLRRALMAQSYALPKGETASECDECDEPIPEERRQAMPGCRLCIACQETLERRQRGQR
ncbi:MAG: TraR/DksA C4-type zinc finger protein [Desulfobulbus sp.]|jgi:phage/conjugal plasmid C-4 type zinc finger TraR family protein|uniref:TraR/DksA C4-type zinc finger protein n=1 Tax=Desulfobulbus sp. TaxID=895 RepID=UPI00284E88EC|nr:TraR/DksA C4-type zinc finger protein [Desulfobulbus sp.]MDR2551437.1 TraR/DksA C4-type zinc finger protein [Desulfobulbus sp.]